MPAHTHTSPFWRMTAPLLPSLCCNVYRMASKHSPPPPRGFHLHACNSRWILRVLLALQIHSMNTVLSHSLSLRPSGHHHTSPPSSSSTSFSSSSSSSSSCHRRDFLRQHAKAGLLLCAITIGQHKHKPDVAGASTPESFSLGSEKLPLRAPTAEQPRIPLPDSTSATGGGGPQPVVQGMRKESKAKAFWHTERCAFIN